MKTNQVMTRTMGKFKVEQRAKDGYFNASYLLKQWNNALKTNFTIEDFVESYIPNSISNIIVEKDNNGVYLPIAFEPQLRLHVANYDMELYDMLNADETVWLLSLPISESASENNAQQTYLMLDETSGAVKIGRAYNPHFRERTLGVQIPRIRLIAICFDDIEHLLHEKYKTKRMRGEWFNLSQKDICNIIKVYGFKTV